MAKKAKLDPRTFQPSWRDDYGFIQQRDRAVCVLCLDAVVMRTSSVKRHFETTHEKNFQEWGRQERVNKKGIVCVWQANELAENATAKQHATEVSYEIAHYNAKRGESIASESRLYPPNEKPGLRHEGAWPLVEFSAIGASSGKTLYKCIYTLWLWSMCATESDQLYPPNNRAFKRETGPGITLTEKWWWWCLLKHKAWLTGDGKTTFKMKENSCLILVKRKEKYCTESMTHYFILVKRKENILQLNVALSLWLLFILFLLKGKRTYWT